MIHRLVISLIANSIGLLGAAYFLPSVDITGSLTEFGITVAILTLIHLILRPIIKLILSPIIALTLGLFSIVINAGILYIVDIYSPNINIGGLDTLLYTTLILLAVNFVMGGGKLFR